MAAPTELNKSLFSGESLGLKGRFFIEDLTDDDQIKDLQNYLSKFGELKACNINKEKKSAPHGVAQYQELKSVDNLMKKENRPHMLNGHAIYIYRELRGTPNFKILRTCRYIRVLSFGGIALNDIQDHELSHHFAQYGTCLDIQPSGNDIKITYDDYDSVDKAILANPHTFNGIPYSVEKCLSSAASTVDTYTSPSSAFVLPAPATPQHHRSAPTIINTKHAGSNVDSRHSTGHNAVKPSSVGSDSLSQSLSSITIVDDRADGNASRIFGHAIKGVREQANPDLPNDVPSEWTSKNSQCGEAGGQGEVRVVYYKNNLEQLAAIKIYSVAAKVKKNNKDLEDYYKERRMRAHREITALKTLQGVENISQLTSYSRDFTNIPDSEGDAVDGKILYWIIMEYIDGRTLEDFVNTFREIDLLNAIKLTQKLLLTIKKVHATGVVHRDIKPNNLLVRLAVNAPIETAEIYVIDFGLSYIKNREDDVNLTSFETRAKYEQTCFGDTIGNCFFRVPQLNSASTKQMTAKEKNVLLDVRRSPTIDASSICAILFWLITKIEPGLRIRDQYNLAPHQNEIANSHIMSKIEEAANRSGIQENWLPKLKTQLTNYLMSTFDKGFENAEHQWTIDQLEYRLESIRHLLQPKTTSFDQQLNDATKNLLSFESVTAVLNLSPIELKFHEISLAYQSAKAKFIAQHSSCSWHDGHCHWSEHQQDMTERKNHDLLSYQYKKKNWMLIVVCSGHFDDNGDIFTLAVGSDFNGVYVELPLGRYTSQKLDNLNIEVEFETELINLLQVISKPKH